MLDWYWIVGTWRHFVHFKSLISDGKFILKEELVTSFTSHSSLSEGSESEKHMDLSRVMNVPHTGVSTAEPGLVKNVTVALTLTSCLCPQLERPSNLQQLQRHQLREVPDGPQPELPAGQTGLQRPGGAFSLWKRVPGERRAVWLRLCGGETNTQFEIVSVCVHVFLPRGFWFLSRTHLLVLFVSSCLASFVSCWSAVWQAATYLFPSSGVNRRWLNESRGVFTPHETASEQTDWLLLWRILILRNHWECTEALRDKPGAPLSKSDLNYLFQLWKTFQEKKKSMSSYIFLIF